MRIALSKFACSGIEAHLGGDIETAVKGALLHYVAKIQAGRKPLRLPRFRKTQGYQSSAGEVILDLTVDPECMALLESDAARQGTSVENLARHAVLLYLAELDRFSLGHPERNS